MPTMEKDDFNEFLRHPILFPDEFKSWLQDWIAVNIPKIPVSQIFGFKIQSVKTGPEVATAQSTSSTSFTDLATVGPTVENLVNGFYVVMFGANRSTTPFDPGIIMGLSIDGAAPDTAQVANLNENNGGGIALVDLSGGDHQHTITAKYKVATAGTSTVSDRWMHALKVVTE